MRIKRQQARAVYATGSTAGDLLKFLLGVAVLVGLMLYVWLSESAAGRTMTLGDFLLYFGREFVLLALFAFAALVAGFFALVRHIDRRRARRVDCDPHQ